MEKIQYIVREGNVNKRREFFDYIINNYKIKVLLDKEHMINNKFPFVVDFKRKQFWVCESVTCCAMAQQNNRIITIDEFMKKISK